MKSNSKGKKAPAKSTPPPVPMNEIVIGTGEAATLLGMTVQHLNRLKTDGYFTPKARGRYVLVEVVQGYIKSLKDSAEKNTKAFGSNATRDARTEEINLRIAEKKRDLIPLIEAISAMDIMVAKVRSEMNGIGARVSREKKLKDKIDEQVDQSFKRVSKTLGATSQTLASGGDVLDAVSESAS